MKMEEINGTTWVTLSRRNLQTLLAKLDGHPTDSACTIQGGTDAWGLFVKAEEDEVHYKHREEWRQSGKLPDSSTVWGRMHPETEEAINNPAFDL